MGPTAVSQPDAACSPRSASRVASTALHRSPVDIAPAFHLLKRAAQVLELEGLGDEFVADGLLLKLYDQSAGGEGDFIGEVAISLEGLLQTNLESPLEHVEPLSTSAEASISFAAWWSRSETVESQVEEIGEDILGEDEHDESGTLTRRSKAHKKGSKKGTMTARGKGTMTARGGSTTKRGGGSHKDGRHSKMGATPRGMNATPRGGHRGHKGHGEEAAES